MIPGASLARSCVYRGWSGLCSPAGGLRIPFVIIGGELVKAKIKRNKEIIKQRAMEARANKGKYSATVPLER